MKTIMAAHPKSLLDLGFNKPAAITNSIMPVTYIIIVGKGIQGGRSCAIDWVLIKCPTPANINNSDKPNTP